MSYTEKTIQSQEDCAPTNGNGLAPSHGQLVDPAAFIKSDGNLDWEKLAKTFNKTLNGKDDFPENTDQDFGKILLEKLKGLAYYLPESNNKRKWAAWNGREKIFTIQPISSASGLHVYYNNVLEDLRKKHETITEKEDAAGAGNPDMMQTVMKRRGEREKFLKKYAHQVNRMHAFNYMGQFASAVYTDFDADPEIFSLNDGEILKLGSRSATGYGIYERASNEPEHRITKRAGVGFSESAVCPNFDKFIAEIFSKWDEEKKAWQRSEETETMVMRYFASCLDGKSAGRDQHILFLNGFGANGKSVLVKVMQQIFGDYAVTIDAEIFLKKESSERNWQKANLHGARLAIIPEKAQSDRLDDETVKRFTGSDFVNAEKKFEDPTSFKVTTKFVWSVNAMPTVSNVSTAVKRRLLIVNMERTFESQQSIERMKKQYDDEMQADGSSEVSLEELERISPRDKGIEESIMAEKEGIFQRLLQHYIDYKRYEIPSPQAVTDDAAEYIETADTIKAFIMERCNPCEYEPANAMLDGKGEISLYAFFEAYKTWCEKIGKFPINITRLRAHINKPGFVSFNVKATKKREKENWRKTSWVIRGLELTSKK